MKNRSAAIDMTIGSPTRHILMFALPLLLGNVLQQLYNMVDSIVVGRFVSDAALAAVGTGFPVIFLLTSFLMGIGMGATIIISQYYGYGDMKTVRRTINTIYTFLMVGAIPLMVAGVLLARPLLLLLDIPQDAYPLASTYVVIIMAGILGTLGYNVNSGILQGLGNSRTPLLFLAIACVINIVLDLLFVIAFHMGVAGVALATVIAQFCSWIFGIIYINKKHPDLHINPFSRVFDRQIFASVLKLGAPIGLQQALFSLGVLALQRLVNSFGTDFVAGFNGANKLDTFAFMPIQSFATACTTYVGQNIGANRLDRVRQGTRATLLLSVCASLLAAAFLLPLGPQFMRLFSESPAVVDAGMAYLNRIMPFYWLLAILFTFNSVMRGAGEIMVPMLSSLISLWLARIPVAYLLAEYLGKDNIYFCYAIGWVPGIIIAGSFYLTGRWKRKAVVPQSAPPSQTPTVPADHLPALDDYIASSDDRE